MFNWVDYDGSATQRSTPAIVGSWPSWWNLGAGCAYEVGKLSDGTTAGRRIVFLWRSRVRCLPSMPLQGEWNAWVCPWREDQKVSRLELRIPGFTKEWDTGGA